MSDEFNYGPRPKKWVYVSEFEAIVKERDQLKAELQQAREFFSKWGIALCLFHQDQQTEPSSALASELRAFLGQLLERIEKEKTSLD